MKQLIVNADDFGLTRGVTDGILEAHHRGIVTSTSIIAQGEAFEYAVERARSHESLAIGVHLTLVEERPVCDARDVATLVQGKGSLPGSYSALVSGILLGRIRLQEIETELRAQVGRCVDAGLRITHLDSHQHVHAWPSILKMVLSIANDFGIRRIRVPRDSPTMRGFFQSRQFVRKSLLCLLARCDARTPPCREHARSDRMAGLFESGNLTEGRLLRILDHLQDGMTELVCHPGRADRACSEAYSHWEYNWDAELSALTSESVRERVRARKIRLATPGHHGLVGTTTDAAGPA